MLSYLGVYTSCQAFTGPVSMRIPTQFYDRGNGKGVYQVPCHDFLIFFFLNIYYCNFSLIPPFLFFIHSFFHPFLFSHSFFQTQVSLDTQMGKTYYITVEGIDGGEFSGKVIPQAAGIFYYLFY